MDETDICHILYPLPRNNNDLMAFSIMIQPSDLTYGSN